MKKHLIFSILLMNVSLIHAEGVQLTCQLYYPACPSCIDNQWLLPFEKFSSDPDALEVEADQSEITEKDNYLFTGNVKLRSDAHYLSADQVLLSKEDQSSKATGGVKYQDNHFFLTGEVLNVKKVNDGLIVDLSNARYQDIKSKANGSAKFVRKTPNNAILEESRYSMCPINDNTWYIKAKTLNFNLNTNRVVADKATFVFFDFPIFYLPKYSWVAKGRGSGFLTPSFNIYKESSLESSDWLIRAPYYINIAPDKDLIITPAYLSSRGALYQGRYRQLIDPSKSQDDGLFEFEFKYLNDDYITNFNRWLVDTSVELDLSDKTHLSLRYNKTSDSEFFREVARDGNSDTRLNSHVKFTYNNPPLPLVRLENGELSGKIDKEKITSVHYDRNIIGNSNTNHLSFVLSSEDEQVVNSGVPDYVKKLETSIFSRSSNSGSKLDLSFMSTKFSHETEGKDTGTRSHGEVNFEKPLGALWPISFSQMSAKTKLGLSHYSLDNKANETRVVGGFDIDLSFPFSRKTTLFGPETTNEIVPMISYDYTSKQEQASIPIFDTTDGIDGYLEYITLLSGERYKGFDRFVNENDITLSLKSIYKDDRLYDENSELIFKLAQRYYGDDEAVSDTENIDFETRRKYSDIFASAELSVNDFDAYAKLEYDPKNFSLVKNRIGFNYKPHPRKFISLIHNDDGSDRNLIISGAYPISNKIHIFGGIDKSLTSGKKNKETTGIAYESCCWAVRLAHFKTSSGVGYDYSTGLELVFKDLGTTDSYIRNRIEKRLPEYRAILD